MTSEITVGVEMASLAPILFSPITSLSFSSSSSSFHSLPGG
jgi:hypothetical protein